MDDTLPVLTADQAVSLARAYFFDLLRTIDAEPPLPAEWTSSETSLFRDELEDRFARLSGPDPEDGIDDVFEAKVAVLQRAGLRAEHDSEPCNLLHNYLRRAKAQATAISIARLSNDFSDQINDALFDRAAAPAPVVGMVRGRRTETRLGQAIDRYLEEVLDIRGVTEKTAQKYRSQLNHIGSFFGTATPVCDIERSDCTRFRDMLAKLPPNFMKKNGGRARSLEQIAKANANGPTLAWITQNNYLKMMDDLMGWALKERLIPDNVAGDIPPLRRREAAESQRLPFQAAELSEIFAQPVFTGCVDDERNFAVPGPNRVRRSRYWLPILALFTGMRMGEILQLTPEHIRVSPNGTAFFVLTRDMRLKTENAEREIPVHPMLERLGFLSWVEEHRRQSKAELFDEVPVSKHGYRSDMFTKRFATFLRRVDLSAHRRSKLCFHSFRHTFKDALNEAGVPEAEMDEICGWSRGKRTGRRYGSGLSADRLKPFVDQVAFDLDLRHLLSRSAE